jgi:two-component system sensor histidine kinase UhpB
MMSALAGYFIAGLTAGESCLWLTSEWGEREAFAALKSCDVAIEEYIADKKLRIISLRDRSAKPGEPEWRVAIEELTRMAANIRIAEFAGLRVASDVLAQALADRRSPGRRESAIGAALANTPSILMCLYPLSGTSAGMRGGAISPHAFVCDARQRIPTESEAHRPSNEHEELRKKAEALQTIFDHIPVMINFVDRNGSIQLVNRQWERTLGWTLAEIQASGIDVISQAYPDPSEREHVKQFINESSAEWSDFTTRTKDGRVIDTTWAVVHLSDGTKIGIGQDITARKGAHQALIESEQRFRQLAENIREVFWIGTPDFEKVLYLSPTYETVWGSSRDELYTNLHRLITSIHPDDRDAAAAVLMNARDKEFEVEYRIVRPDGGIRWIRDRGFPVRDEQGKVVRFAGLAEDITERRQFEEQLKTTTTQLRALSARLQSAREEEGTRISREIHDELGSVMSSLKWEMEALEKICTDSDRVPDAIGVKQKLEAMMQLADAGITSIRRIASELRPSILDDLGLSEAVEWQGQQFQLRTGIVCTFRSSAEHAQLNREQSTAAFRIVQEALTNILRHAHATKVDIRVEGSESELRVSVTDNGKGISEDDISHPTSLGLMGMQERAHRIGGAITIAGAPGAGTTVTVRVPLGNRSGSAECSGV